MKRLAFSAFIFLIFLNILSSDINLTGWKLVQDSSSVTYTFGDITVPSGGYLIICRGDVTREEFEAFWGVTLDSNVIFLDSVSPLIPLNNGRETYSLYDSSGVLQDTTMPRANNNDKCMRRDSSNVFTFTLIQTSISSPGTFTNGGSGAGMIITEFADTGGTGNYVYNFIELHNDTLKLSGTQGKTESKINPNKTGGSFKNNVIYFTVGCVMEGYSDVFLADVSGRIIFSSSVMLKVGEGKIEVRSITPGIYFLTVKGETSIAVIKLLRI
ncbi:MAG: hypothetical protein PHW02_00755 [bacterium]|nr:hypothetical protein [bacterium]